MLLCTAPELVARPADRLELFQVFSVICKEAKIHCICIDGFYNCAQERAGFSQLLVGEDFVFKISYEKLACLTYQEDTVPCAFSLCERARISAIPMIL